MFVPDREQAAVERDDEKIWAGSTRFGSTPGANGAGAMNPNLSDFTFLQGVRVVDLT